ncbi:MAG: peptidylprolyl isomerase [Pseudomonadota bacterium]
MPITNNTVVSIHYTLTDDAGTTLDSSIGDDPLTYLHGSGSIILGLERELEGREVGDELSVSISPADGYGEKDEALIMKVPLDNLSHVEGLEPGMQLQAQTQDGHTQMLVVESVDATSATLNGNHPLAGKRLHFEVTVESLREATEEEIDHGHVH